uniref:Uncharacterized protein n=1 Tax=Anguilla anguilla TaxID=7936 RepID=A0A0E9UEH6_ANGAN
MRKADQVHFSIPDAFSHSSLATYAQPDLISKISVTGSLLSHKITFS